MAHLKTKATTGNPPEREAWKWRIIRGLYERGLTKTDVIKLFKIIDTMMTLPKELQTGLVRKIRSFEEEKKMPLISPMALAKLILALTFPSIIHRLSNKITQYTNITHVICQLAPTLGSSVV